VSCYDGLDWAALVDSGYPDLKGHEAEVYGSLALRDPAGGFACSGAHGGFARCPLKRAVGGRP